MAVRDEKWEEYKVGRLRVLYDTKDSIEKEVTLLKKSKAKHLLNNAQLRLAKVLIQIEKLEYSQ